MQPTLTASGLGKKFTLPGRRSDSLKAAVSALTRRAPETQPQSFWAFRGVDLKIAPGQALGLLGNNGSGKSTVLKVLSRVFAPSEGRAVCRGRVAALLEVGTGFHPELTGRENIWLNGSILGLSQREIAERFDDIVAFSEVESFLDLPVKRYSSGMYVRLAFSIAAHVQPSLLIVDEVLAVGDERFQRKCLDHIKAYVAGGGALIFVTHSLSLYRELCTDALWLDRGLPHMAGAPLEEVLEAYLESNRADGSAQEQPTEDPSC